MHGQGCEERQERWHMWPAPSQRPAFDSISEFSGGKCFSKDGRRINIGDCALFQAGNAPPFIGIIRNLTSDKEGVLKVVVNWLYRPGDIRLGKGVPVEAAPNEIFYSFHRDEISGVSLLHPCKVAFLRKGIELPPGVSSFVCRRVYDTATKCLWWLTDRDYTDDHQEEVDQLLDRTKQEMQAAVQTGGPSPRSHAGSSSSHQLKVNSEAIRNVSLPTQGKGRKRERIDQSSDPCKRERSMKMDNSAAGHMKWERCVKPEEITNIIDKDGGLLNLPSVDQLVHLMQQDCNDSAKKAGDVASRRTMLAGIIASTEKEECLNRFVQLGGLPMLNEWLQEAHKGKDGGSPREGDKGLEELLLMLLQALDKLPVNLDALKKCIVGKSVNNLRSHKNIEIQKKARKLVDTWKKRVDAEMKMSGDVKNVPNPTSKQSSVDPPQVLHSMKESAASEVTSKSIQTVKAVANSTCLEDSVIAYVSNPLGGGKSQSLAIGSKEHHVKVHAGGLTEAVSIGAVKEERSSSSSQSQNSQSWSSGPAKRTSPTWKEDVRTSSAISAGDKAGSTAMRSNITSNKVHSSGSTGSQRESVGGKSLVWVRGAAYEKVANSGLADKESSESVKSENLNNQRLIVRLPNPGRSPACTASGGSVADLPTSSRGSSPSLLDRHDVVEGKNKIINSSQLVNSLDAGIDTDCGSASKFDFGSGDVKERPSSAISADYTECRCVEFQQILNIERGDGRKGVFTAEISTSAEVCTAGSEIHTADANEVGIGLLASVAANENSEVRKCVIDTLMERHDVPVATGGGELESGTKSLTKTDPLRLNQKVGSLVGAVSDTDEKEREGASGIESRSFSGNCDVSEVEISRGGKESAKLLSARICGHIETDSHQVGTSKGNGMIEERSGGGLSAPTSVTPDCSITMDRFIISAKEVDGSGVSEGGGGVPKEDRGIEETISTKLGADVEHHQQSGTDAHIDDTGSPEERYEDAKVLLTKASTSIRMSSIVDVPRAAEMASQCYEEDALEVARQVAKEVEQEVEKNGKPDQQDANLPATCKTEEFDVAKALTGETDSMVKVESPCEHLRRTMVAFPDDSQETETERREDRDAERADGAGEAEEVDQTPNASDNVDRVKVAIDAMLGTSVDTCEMEKRLVCIDEESHSHTALLPQDVVEIATCETRTREATEVEKSDKVCNGGPTAESSLRPFFDLNEGIVLDESLPDDAKTPTILVNPAIPFPGLASAPVATSNGLAVPIAVVATTKGPFIPPSNSLRCKGELGWKGSAATSAFRPAEPRRTPERLQCSTDVLGMNVAIGLSKKRPQPLDIDLNVADEMVLEDVTALNAVPLQGSLLHLDVLTSSLGSSSQTEGTTAVAAYANGGSNSVSVANFCGTAARPELDLNRVDESEESAIPLISDLIGAKMISLGTRNSFSSVIRDFDLNDGPSLDEALGDGCAVQSSDNKIPGVSVLPLLPGLRLNPEVNGAPWFPPGRSLSALPMPAFPATRAEPPYPVVAAASANSFLCAGSSSNPFNGDSYRTGPVLSSLAVSYSTTMPAAFPYTEFALGSNLPLSATSLATNTASYLDSSASTAFPAVPSQLVSAGAVVSPYGRPYLIGTTEVSCIESGATWSRPNLDLNAGPDPVDMDSREEGPVTRQACSFGQLGQLSFQKPGIAVGAAKRKEPEGGFDPPRPGFNHTTWR